MIEVRSSEFEVRCPRIMIAATKSASGKTTITTGLIKALSDKGLKIAAFKSGPDYIDASYLSYASKSPCRNLDSWMIPKNNLVNLFTQGCKDKDLALIEGAMGLFDGKGLTTKGSSAHLAKTLGCPIILVIDATHMGLSASAIAFGFKNIDPDLNICGVILNNISSNRHLSILKKALKNASLPLVGFLFKDQELTFNKRHLGLHMAGEIKKIDEKIEKITSEIEQHFDLNKLIRIANIAPHLNPLPKGERKPFIGASSPSPRRGEGWGEGQKITIGIAKDAAFNFYYQDNIDLLKQAGAKIVYFSPIKDKELPTVDGLYFGGGYPELYADKLAANTSLKKQIRQAIEDKMPVYAECGGFLYLSDKLTTNKGSYEMVGALEASSKMQPSFVALGYAKANPTKTSILFNRIDSVKGHHFHYSKTQYRQNNNFAYLLEDGQKQGCVYKNTLASYLHLHFGTDNRLARNFVASCKEFS